MPDWRQEWPQRGGGWHGIASRSRLLCLLAAAAGGGTSPALPAIRHPLSPRSSPCPALIQAPAGMQHVLEAMPRLALYSSGRAGGPAARSLHQAAPRRRLASSAAAAAAAGGGSGVPAPGEAAKRVESLFAMHPTLTLERAVGDKHGIDQNLWDSCHFRAEIYPDLPLATTWRDLLRRTVQTAGRDSEAGWVGPAAQACPAERWTVRTVAAQLRSRDQLRAMMLSAAGVDASGDPKPGGSSADALLFVSGSHPARHLPGATK